MTFLTDSQHLLALALVLGAVLGTLSRLWAAPNIDMKSRRTLNEVVGNGLTALVIPYLSVIPVIGENLDVTKMPKIAAFVVMYFIASGSGDFLGNLRRKIIPGSNGTPPSTTGGAKP